eukprot:scaffold80607_cov27-Attheya_sp.AAC.1
MSDDTFTSPTMIRLEEKEHRGKVVVAVSNFDPGISGLELLAEKALLVSPPFGSETDSSPTMPRKLRSMDPQMWASYWCYKSQSDEVKAKVQDFYVELDCAKAQTVHDIVASIAVREKIDVSEFVRISMVFNFNAVRVSPDAAEGQGAGRNFGIGMFEIACRISQEGKKELVRVVATVSEGEELTIDYSSENLLSPTYLRRKALLESKFFVCACERCSNQDYDETRRFKCTANQCNGVHFIHQSDNDTQPIFLECTDCSKAVTTSKA